MEPPHGKRFTLLQATCACAAARDDGCQWRQESRTVFGKGRCRARRGWRRGDTSCAECPSQKGCSATDLWERLGQSMPLLSPELRVFSSEQKMLDLIFQKGSEAERRAPGMENNATYFGHSYPRLYEKTKKLENGTLVSYNASEAICMGVIFKDVNLCCMSIDCCTP